MVSSICSVENNYEIAAQQFQGKHIISRKLRNDNEGEKNGRKVKKKQQKLQSYAWQLYLIAILNTKVLASKKVFEERSGWAGTWRMAMNAAQQREQDKFWIKHSILISRWKIKETQGNEVKEVEWGSII